MILMVEIRDRDVVGDGRVRADRKCGGGNDRAALLDADPGQGRPGNGLAFRLKLLLAAGFVPQLAACAACGEQQHLRGFSASAGGVVCTACEAAAFPLDEESYRFLVDALGRPLADAPDGSDRALRQVERAITETAAHHANVRLRPLLVQRSENLFAL